MDKDMAETRRKQLGLPTTATDEECEAAEKVAAEKVKELRRAQDRRDIGLPVTATDEEYMAEYRRLKRRHDVGLPDTATDEECEAKEKKEHERQYRRWVEVEERRDIAEKNGEISPRYVTAGIIEKALLRRANLGLPEKPSAALIEELRGQNLSIKKLQEQAMGGTADVPCKLWSSIGSQDHGGVPVDHQWPHAKTHGPDQHWYSEPEVYPRYLMGPYWGGGPAGIYIEQGDGRQDPGPKEALLVLLANETECRHKERRVHFGLPLDASQGALDRAEYKGWAAAEQRREQMEEQSKQDIEAREQELQAQSDALNAQIAAHDEKMRASQEAADAETAARDEAFRAMMDGRQADREAARLERVAQKEEAEEATAERYALLLSGMSKEEIDEQVAAEVAVAVVEEAEEGEVAATHLVAHTARAAPAAAPSGGPATAHTEEAAGGDGDGGGAFGGGGGFLKPDEQRIGSYVEDSFGNVYYK